MHRKLDNLILLFENSLLVITLTGMVLLALAQIVMRNLFDMGVEWSEPLLRVMVLWLGLLGAITATRQNKHITIDILSRRLPPSMKLASVVISNLFSAVICGIIAWHSAQFVLMEYEDGMEAFSGVPVWICELILPIGFSLMALRFFINCFRPSQLINPPGA